MVVISLEPVSLMMERAGMATGTRNVAIRQWGGVLPDRAPDELARELYDAENRGKAEPSGSQDMIGIIYPGVNRLDYDADCEGGVFPAHIESNCDPKVAAWIEDVLQVIPVAQRPEGYNPLGIMNLDPDWISRLGRTGTDCFDALVAMDLRGLGASMNECMRCWEAILPHTVRHPTHPHRSERPPALLPIALCGRDVLRLRRRLPPGGIAGAGSGVLPHPGAARRIDRGLGLPVQ